MELPETKPPAPRNKPRITRLGWRLLIAQATLFPGFLLVLHLESLIPGLYSNEPPVSTITLLCFLFALLVLVVIYSNHERGFKPVYRLLHYLVAWAVGIVFIFAYAQITMAIYFRTHSQGSNAPEVKQNLHAIQLAVERYATDNEGRYYPDFLLGGYLLDDYTVTAGFFNGALKASKEEPDKYMSFDGQSPEHFALDLGGDYTMMEGYMPSYPRNPFHRKLEHHGQLRAQVFPSFPPGPYRRVNLEKPYEQTNARMVQIAADHRYPGALIGERYWLRIHRGLLADSLAGNFIYKGLIPPGEKHPRGYVLMVFGGPEDEGEDALTTVPGGHELDGRLQDGSGVGMGVPVIPELGIKGDGKPDGVILVLTGGWPFEKQEKARKSS